MTGTVVGAIKTDRKPRTRLSQADKAALYDRQIAALDRQIEKKQQRRNVLSQKRAALVANLRAALAEVEAVKP